MEFDNIIIELAVIFAGSAAFATLFLYLKQPVILAYIVLGMIVGPSGFKLINNAEHIEQLSHIGIILLLFLIGLNLQPERLYKLFGKVAFITVITSLLFLLVGLATALMFDFSFLESLIIGAAMMFSSTIVALKLIPTTTLHHRHTGEMMIGVLLFQDIIAIVLILLMTSGQQDDVLLTVIVLMVKLLALIAISFAIVKHVIMGLLMRFDTIREYIFLLSLGWGLLLAMIANSLGLSFEIGAFVAGVTFATTPIALVIAEDLKPLRDFFLVLFFFSIGASFDWLVSRQVLLSGLVLAVVMMLVKPFVFSLAFRFIKEKKALADELGSRLGQASEFSLLVAYSAVLSGLIGERAASLIQLVVVLTFIASTYRVVLNYRTPISSTDRRRLD